MVCVFWEYVMQMKIFISHSSKDEEIYKNLADSLRKQGHTVFNSIDINIGDIWIEKIKNALYESDILIAIITENFLSSSWAQAELSSVVLGTNNIRLLPVVVGDVFVPGFIAQFQYRKVKSEEDIISAVLMDIAKLNNIEDSPLLFQKKKSVQEEENRLEEKIDLLKGALIDNQLTLVCGAGVSIDSSISTWNELLVNILNDIYSNDSDSSTENKVTAESLLSLMPQSNLILGKYLKLILKEDFNKTVQKHLYLNYNFFYEFEPINPNLETNMMKAIVELSRPKRSGKRLESIITFNFDDLIERALSNHNIEHTSIWKEGQAYGIDSLPIFHVHGFLPNEKDVEEPNLVFSEEAYHSQFIDPYSWSNLIQLNIFSTNVCLFIGLSLSDPNLRRLLDISWRRNQRCKHYIIMKKPPQISKTNEIVTMLCEQDANSLGLNVIWCSDFSEIPSILLKIVK